MTEIERLRAAVVRQWRLGRMTADEAAESLGVPADIFNAIAYSVGPPQAPAEAETKPSDRSADAVDRRCVILVRDAALEIAGKAGDPPSVAELAAATGYKDTTVEWAIRRLVSHGLWPYGERPEPARRRPAPGIRGQVLEAAGMLMEQHGRTPTHHEIADLIGAKPANVYSMIYRLKKEGIRKEDA